MVRCLVLVALGLWVNATTLNAGGFRVLVFTKTLGFRHDSIPNGIAAVRALGAANNFTVTATEDATAFNDTNLTSFACVIFLSTTGEVLDATQQAAFQRYIEAGGGFVGIHAAADTEYSWPRYGQLVGAYFKSHPAVQLATIKINDFVHPSTVGLPKRWIRTDEWYSFQSNPRGKVHVLATLDEGTYPPVDRMGFDHPTAWCHNFDGGRAWYTGGGHTQASYSGPDFLRHILGGLLWAAGAQPGDADATIDTHFQKVILDPTPQDPMQMSIAADGRVFYDERAGKVKMWKPDTRSTVVVGTIAIDEGREDGLLGIALDPNFATNHWLYLFYSPPGNVSEQHVSRFTLSGETIDLASEKDPLTYSWSFYGDWKVDTTDPNPTFQYTTPGNYQARLTVMDNNGNSAVANLAIVVGNTPPVVSIVEPPNGAFFDWGANIRFNVQAFDAEDGVVPCDQIQVEPKLGHNDHAHDEGSFPGCDGVFQAPVKDDPDTDLLFLVLRASVTDKGNPPAAPLLGRTVFEKSPMRRLSEAQFGYRFSRSCGGPVGFACAESARSEPPRLTRRFALPM